MNWIEALILGIVQGLTEFLPVSSSGHLEIAQALLGTISEENLLFAIIVHTATVLSTFVVLRSEISWLFKGTFSTTKWNIEKAYVAKIILSMIPIFVVGIFFKEYVESLFGNGLLIVGTCLIITSGLLWLSEYITNKREKRTRTTSKVTSNEISYWAAFVIGISQALAVLPGLSRSGTTIATGLLCGVKKSKIAQFSFLMVLFPILGESFLTLIELIQKSEKITAIPFSSLIIGFWGAFITGCFACKFMINIVKRGKLIYFAIYCLLIGTFAIFYNFFI